MRNTVLVLMLAISLALTRAQDASARGESSEVVKSQLSRSAEESLVPPSGDRLL